MCDPTEPSVWKQLLQTLQVTPIAKIKENFNQKMKMTSPTKYQELFDNNRKKYKNILQYDKILQYRPIFENICQYLIMPIVGSLTVSDVFHC